MHLGVDKAVGNDLGQNFTRQGSWGVPSALSGLGPGELRSELRYKSRTKNEVGAGTKR